MPRLLLLLSAFGLFSCCDCPKEIRVEMPPNRKAATQQLVVTIDKTNHYLVGSKTVEKGMLDSFLQRGIDSLRKTTDSITVVIHADSLAFYGSVYNIMRAAKMKGVKVITAVDRN